MARKPRSAKTTRKSVSTAAPTAVSADDILDAALDEAAAVGWRTMSLASVAQRAGADLGAVLLKTPTKYSLLAGFLDRVDELTFASVRAPDPQDSARDRLFEIIMRRFDAFNTHREGARAFISGAARDPVALACVGLRAHRTMAAILAAADIPADGLMGCLRVQGLKAVFLAALRAWMTDDTDDLSKTMAALDRGLAQAERAERFLRGGRRTVEPVAE